ERVPVFLYPLHVVRGAHCVRDSLFMRIKPLEICQMQQGRAATVPRARYCLARRVVHLEEVRPTDTPSRHAKALGPLDVIASAGPATGGGLSVTVLLDDLDRRAL